MTAFSPVHQGRWWVAYAKPGDAPNLPVDYDTKVDQLVKQAIFCDNSHFEDCISVFRWENGKTYLPLEFIPRAKRQCVFEGNADGKVILSALGPVVIIERDYCRGALLVAKARFPWTLWKYALPFVRFGHFCKAWYELNRRFFTKKAM